MTQRGLLRPLMLVVVALATAFIAIRQGAVQTASRHPSMAVLASRLAPDDPGSLALAARAALAKAAAQKPPAGQQTSSLLPQQSRDLQEGGKMAAEALAGDITQVDAMAVYGVAANARGDVGMARAIMRASDSLSKRDLVTRLWLIEDAAKRERLPEMLRHIDVALRVSATAQNAMFPLLARALADERLVPDFIKILRLEPPWTEAFLYVAATSGYGTKNLAKIYLTLGREYEHQGQELSALLMEQLIAQKAYAEAFEFERGLTGQRFVGTFVRDPAFVNHMGLEPLNWLLTSSAAFDAARSTDSFGNTGLELLSSGSGAEVVARELLSLRPGRYRFTNAVTSDYGEVKLKLEWRLRCADNDATLGRFVPLSNKIAIWNVPASCKFQWLELYADAGGTVSSETVFIRPIRMDRVGAEQAK